jgi:GAF domain-containing protein
MTTPSNDRASSGVAAELQRLLLGAPGVEVFLCDVARYAAGAVENALSCGLTVSATRTSAILGGTSDDLAKALDGVQYDVDDGPCLTALRTCRTVRVDDIAKDTRWEAFSRRARQAGAGSSMSVPMRINGEAVGALNLYSGDAHGLTDDDHARAHQFADQAAGAVALARLLQEREDAAQHLQAALVSRSTIDQAIGIMIAQTGAAPGRAFELLRTQSQHTNQKLRDLATDIVTRAVHHSP